MSQERDIAFYDVMPANDWFARGSVTMIYVHRDFYKTHLLDMGYCIDAPSVMPGGSLKRQDVDMGPYDEGFYFAQQTTVEREP